MNYIRIKEMLKEHDDNLEQIILRVLKAEEEKISLKNPKGIKDDLKSIIEEVIDDDNK